MRSVVSTYQKLKIFSLALFLCMIHVSFFEVSFVLCPLLRLGADPVGFAHVDDEDSATPGGVLGAKRVSVADLEAKEVATLRLELTDDKILDSTVGKTPVMVLQEHCHKHVGRVPTYTDVTETAQGQRAPRKASVR